MSPAELRSSGLVQGGIIAAVLAFLLHRTPAGAETATWTYLLGGYGLLAALAPWLAGAYDPSEFSARYSVVAFLFLVLPATCCAVLLWPTPYRAIALGAVLVCAAWFLHFLFALLRPAFRRD